MKTATVILLIVLASAQAFGQKKSKEDPKDLKIDSLTTANALLLLKIDSLSNGMVAYTGLYNAIKENVIHYNFDPTRSEFLIDSLKATRDSALLIAPPTSVNTLLTDSLNMLKYENKMLRNAVDSMKTVVSEKLSAANNMEIEKAKAVLNLRQLKELYDAKIITDAEFIALKKKYLEKL